MDRFPRGERLRRGRRPRRSRRRGRVAGPGNRPARRSRRAAGCAVQRGGDRVHYAILQEEEPVERAVDRRGVDRIARPRVDQTRDDAQPVPGPLIAAGDEPPRAELAGSQARGEILRGSGAAGTGIVPAVRGDVELQEPRQRGPQRLDEPGADPPVAGRAADVGERGNRDPLRT